MTRREFWDERKFLQDTAGELAPDRVAKAVGLERTMDSTYEIPKRFYGSLGLLKLFLETKGFEYNPEMGTKFKQQVLE